MDDEIRYLQWTLERQDMWESLCRHCGACCGLADDPCEHLLMTPEGRSSCRVYDDRLGPHLTVSGREFNCVPVRHKLGTSWPGDERCPYKRI